jgi:hypothetical protein
MFVDDETHPEPLKRKASAETYCKHKFDNHWRPNRYSNKEEFDLR